MPAQFSRSAHSFLQSIHDAITYPFKCSGETFARQNFTISLELSEFSVRPAALSFFDTQFVGRATMSNPALSRSMKSLSLGR